jgi:branched-chain amino acid transport system substrate-binding protein
MKTLARIATLLVGCTSTLAAADINVGVTLSATGPAASLGIPEKNTIALLPRMIGGQQVNYLVLDDGSDTTSAVANARKLVTEARWTSCWVRPRRPTRSR